MPSSLFDAEVALDGLRDFMIELHDIIRTVWTQQVPQEIHLFAS